MIGDVKGKTAVIVDDIIDTAGTLRAAAETVKAEGARCVFAAATHAVLSGNAFENLEAAGFEQVVVTDTIPLRPGAPDNIKVPVGGRHPHRHDPPHLHRRLGVRGVRRREPARSEPASPSGAAGPLRRGAAHDPRRGPARGGLRRPRSTSPSCRSCSTCWPSTTGAPRSGGGSARRARTGARSTSCSPATSRPSR